MNQNTKSDCLMKKITNLTYLDEKVLKGHSLVGIVVDMGKSVVGKNSQLGCHKKNLNKTSSWHQQLVFRIRDQPNLLFFSSHFFPFFRKFKAIFKNIQKNFECVLESSETWRKTWSRKNHLFPLFPRSAFDFWVRSRSGSVKKITDPKWWQQQHWDYS